MINILKFVLILGLMYVAFGVPDGEIEFKAHDKPFLVLGSMARNPENREKPVKAVLTVDYFKGYWVGSNGTFMFIDLARGIMLIVNKNETHYFEPVRKLTDGKALIQYEEDYGNDILSVESNNRISYAYEGTPDNKVFYTRKTK